MPVERRLTALGTLRGMRESPITAVDEVYVLDLHSNAPNKEVASDGSKDENVLSISSKGLRSP